MIWNPLRARRERDMSTTRSIKDGRCWNCQCGNFHALTADVWLALVSRSTLKDRDGE